MKLKYPLIVLLTSLLASSCNVFDPLDSPTNDEQMLSAARNCFDEGDIECAKAWYQRLSGGYRDVQASEMAFAVLHQNGITMAMFLGALGKGGNGGAGLNTLANKIGGSASESLRVQIMTSYQYVNAINYPELRGFVRFVVAFTLAAEILAEDSGTDQILQKTDIVSSVSGCSCLSCPASSTDLLTPSASKDLIYSGSNLPSYAGSPTLGMLSGALNAIVYALSSEIVAGGNYSSVTGAFAQALGLLPSTNGDCYRYTLISKGIGN